MSAHTELQQGIGEAFDALSGEFHPDSVVTLVKPSTEYDEYDTVLTVSTKRFFEFSNYRKNVLLEISDTSAALTTAIEEATHIKIDDDYYVINRDDSVAPKSTDVTWKLFGDYYQKETDYRAL